MTLKQSFPNSKICRLSFIETWYGKNNVFFLNLCVCVVEGGRGGARWIYIFGKGLLNQTHPFPISWSHAWHHYKETPMLFQFLIIFPINVSNQFFRSFFRSFFDHFFSTISSDKFQTPFLLSKRDYWLCNSGRALKEEFEYNKVLDWS
jgi:hypothetical protein